MSPVYLSPYDESLSEPRSWCFYDDGVVYACTCGQVYHVNGAKGGDIFCLVCDECGGHFAAVFVTKETRQKHGKKASLTHEQFLTAYYQARKLQPKPKGAKND